MANYTIRTTGIDGNYMASEFAASSFAAIKQELTRADTPFRRNWSVHNDDGCVFTESDWQDAERCVAMGEASTISLKLLRECREFDA
ncbi:hypothetical protein ACT3OH_02060 [Vreelandella zhanjiangensis]|uniref:hypothetical protein n=1 Tax=Vreelandella zhanjiangensis TaxID=1121960 RepID=UPI00402ACB04